VAAREAEHPEHRVDLTLDRVRSVPPAGSLEDRIDLAVADQVEWITSTHAACVSHRRIH